MIGDHVVILAPSGTGKSTLVKKHNTEIIDGDLLSFAVVDASKFDLGQPWWKHRRDKPDTAKYVAAIQKAFLENAFADKSNRPILWAWVEGGDPRVEAQINAAVDAVVVPTATELHAHLKKREEGNPDRPGTTMDTVDAIIRDHIRTASDRNIPVYGAFSKVPALKKFF